MFPPPPSSTLFPYTTLFRSLPVIIAVWLVHRVVTRDRLIPLEQIDVSGIEVKASK